MRLISQKKNEPEWLLEWRLKAYRLWLTMKEPTWQNVKYDPINYQDIIYYSAPKKKKVAQQPGRSRSGSARDVRQARHPARRAEAARRRRRRRGVRQRLGRDDVPREAGEAGDHLHVVLRGGAAPPRAREEVSRLGRAAHRQLLRRANSAVFSDGSFVYIPKGVRCPMELSTYFRINAKDTGQFERTLIIADEGAFVSYLEGCTAPMRDENQLHAAVVELVAHDDATIKYSTIQNWYPGDKEGKGGHLQLRDQARPVRRAAARRSPGPRSRPARRSPGSIPAASCRGTTRSASSTRSRRPTTGSRPTPARR